ncbi:30S ribosomal protein S27ae [Candidatus Micrarchaeota archaeon]|nr:30S ribosomal protein S27ae [Candidatus Micrarchaeota archaeon]
MAKGKDKPKKEKKKRNIKHWPYKKGRSCPKCGPGVKLAEHKDRFSCGRCGYYEKK